MTAVLHRGASLDPTVMDAQTMIRLATVKGAESIGMKHTIGSLEQGKQADIIILDTRKPHLVPLFNPISHLVYSASGSDVRHVMVGGRWVVKDGAMLTLDIEEIMDSVNQIGEAVQAGMA